MRTTAIAVCMWFVMAGAGFARKHIIVSTSSFTFSPASLTIVLGDTVQFVLESIHNAQEVSQATWNVNGATKLAGGFETPFGGGTVVPTTTGAHYYVCVPHASSGMKGIITVNPKTDVSRTGRIEPSEFSLGQNYPNPFNESTCIRFTLPQSGHVNLTIFNAVGQNVQTLVDGEYGPGIHDVVWDARRMVSGLYFYTIRVSSTTDRGKTAVETRKLSYLK